MLYNEEDIVYYLDQVTPQDHPFRDVNGKTAKSREARISKEAIKTISDLANIILDRYCSTFNIMKRTNEIEKILLPNHVEIASKLLISGELKMQLISELAQSPFTQRFRIDMGHIKKILDERVNIRMDNNKPITIKQFKKINSHNSALKYIATAIEYLIYEILNVSETYAYEVYDKAKSKNKNKYELTNKHILNGIKHDEELGLLFKNIVIKNGGVSTKIHSEFFENNITSFGGSGNTKKKL